jgi:ribose 5-phosphate isomerase B
MKVALASDHAGYAEKERLKAVLTDLGVEFDDLGTASEASVDYPDYARKVAEQVAQGQVEQGLLVCGSGTGMAITANKVRGVRAAVAWSEETARLARQHNDANVLAIGARTTPPADIPKIVRAWFSTEEQKTPRFCRRNIKKCQAFTRNAWHFSFHLHKLNKSQKFHNDFCCLVSSCCCVWIEG